MGRKLNLIKVHEHFRASKQPNGIKKQRKSYEKTTCYNNKLLCTAAVPDPLTAQQEPAEPRAQLEILKNGNLVSFLPRTVAYTGWTMML